MFYLNNLSFTSPGADRNSSCGNLNPKNIEDKNVNMWTGFFLPETDQDWPILEVPIPNYILCLVKYD